MRALAAFVPVCSPAITFADLQGIVADVADGDTLTVLAGGAPVRVRISGIDAPERAQPFGKVAKRALADVVFRQIVEVFGSGDDRYGRLVGKVVYQGRDIGLELVRAGLAWWYRRYASEQLPEDRALYQAAESEARAGAVGL